MRKKLLITLFIIFALVMFGGAAFAITAGEKSDKNATVSDNPVQKVVGLGKGIWAKVQGILEKYTKEPASKLWQKAKDFFNQEIMKKRVELIQKEFFKETKEMGEDIPKTANILLNFVKNIGQKN